MLVDEKAFILLQRYVKIFNYQIIFKLFFKKIFYM